MYGRLHQRKLREDDYIMSCQKARAELDSYVDQEARRVNVDSAKKRAVLQHMDYEGFRQMVLGANIFPTKSLELQKFSKGENIQTVNNKFYNNNEGEIENQHKARVSLQLMRKVEGKSQMQCNSFREFKKKFNETYPSNHQLDPLKAQKLYNLIKYQDQGHIAKIFNVQCQANILVKIITVFEYIIGYLRDSDDEGKVVKQIVYQIKLLQIILKLKNMAEFNLTILTKKQKQRIVNFLLSAKQYILVGKCGDRKEKQEEQKNESKGQSKQQVVKDQDEKIIDQLVQILAKK